jgi:hypothetical protein
VRGGLLLAGPLDLSFCSIGVRWGGGGVARTVRS